MHWHSLILLTYLFATHVNCDTPADCRYEDIQGRWLFSITNTGHKQGVDCSKIGPVNIRYVIDLNYPDLAVDQFGNAGHWTLIYNQGFEVTVAGRKYFAFSKYKTDGENVTSLCGETLMGWTHNVIGQNWGCYSAQKTKPIAPRSHSHPLLTLPRHFSQENLNFDSALVDAINRAQTSWKAGPNVLKTKSLNDLVTLAGGRKSMLLHKPKPAPASLKVQKLAAALPAAWDWRSVDGINYVSPVRNQGGCGSCYAFASMGMLESRLRILTNNTLQAILSPQDIVECSKYSQGCDGGFPYLIAGKYAEDFGAVPEVCNPYKGMDDDCTTKRNCPVRYFATEYKYVGGYYGGCNEEFMMLQLVKNGPMAVGFEVYPDFMHYHGGVYHHVKSSDDVVPKSLRKFYPFELTNHAVLLVGYGVDTPSGEKFWIVKNSWSTSWGENGFFRIRRGTDECGIESTSLESFPVL